LTAAVIAFLAAWCQHREGRDSVVLSGPFRQRRFSDPCQHFWHK